MILIGRISLHPAISFHQSAQASRWLGAILSSAPQRVVAQRPFSLSLRDMTPKNDYIRWTKESLIRRVQQLEAELTQRSVDAPAAPISAQVVEGPAADETHVDGEPPRKKRKKGGPIDPSKYTTRYIALKIAYLGRKYAGFEYQAYGVTIEEELWKALTKSCLIFTNQPDEVDFNVCEYSKCGRTDAGVSAFGQVIGLRVRSNEPVRTAVPPTEGDAAGGQSQGDDVNMSEGTEAQENAPYPVEKEIDYCRVLNKLLPPEIRVLAWCPSPPPGFSARFSCRERQYRYFFTDPAFTPTPGSSDQRLDIDAMRTAARKYIGSHDFRNLCQIDANKQITNFTRVIFDSDIEEVRGVESSLPYLQLIAEPNAVDGNPERLPKVYSFNVRGSAFLWHQIRHMVAILFLIGQRLEKPMLVDELLDVAKNPRRPAYRMADDVPLVLWDCIFPAPDDEERKDALQWVWAGEKDGLGAFSRQGAVELLWTGWRDKKMDELLANRLLDWVTERVEMPEANARHGKEGSRRVFEGASTLNIVGKYKPVMQRQLMGTVEEINNKLARKKGFTDSEAMRQAKAEARAAKGSPPLPPVEHAE
jgi:tRNA pseudouridine38/39 synthase